MFTPKHLEQIVTDNELGIEQRRACAYQLIPNPNVDVKEELIRRSVMASASSVERKLRLLREFFPNGDEEDWRKQLHVQELIASREAMNREEPFKKPINPALSSFLGELADVYRSVGKELVLKPGASDRLLDELEKLWPFAIDPLLLDLLRISDGTDNVIFAFMGKRGLPEVCRACGTDELLWQCCSIGQKLQDGPLGQGNAVGMHRYGWDARVKETFSTSKRLVFGAYNGTEALAMLDYAPSPQGHTGQVVGFVEDDGLMYCLSPRFGDFLTESLRLIGCFRKELLADMP